MYKVLLYFDKKFLYNKFLLVNFFKFFFFFIWIINKLYMDFVRQIYV